MNDNETLQEQNAREAADLRAARTSSEKGNKKYASERKKYQDWVDSFPNRGNLNIPVAVNQTYYVSKDAIETYYTQVQKLRKCKRSTAEKTCLALNKLVLLEKSDLGDIRTGPTGEVVISVLDHIESEYEKRVSNSKECPHKDKPTDIIDQEEISKVLHKLLGRHDKNWADTAVAFSITTQTLLRFDSASKLTLSKFYVLTDLPPHGTESPVDVDTWADVRAKIDGRILGCIIPPLDQIKKNSNHQNRTSEVVGGYRHKRIERCYIGIMAFMLLEKLADQSRKISFKAVAPDGFEHWSDVKIFEFGYSAANKSIKTAMEKAGVEEWNKVTHMR